MSSSASLDEKSINIVIKNVSRLKTFCSDQVILQNIPWQIEVTRHKAQLSDNTIPSDTLAIHLHASYPGIRQVWACAAMVNIELLRFDGHAPLTNVIGPWVFGGHEMTWSRNKLLFWTDLFDRNAGYVINNQLRMHFKVSTKLLTEPSIRLHYQEIFNVFQIYFPIENVHNLMATASDSFIFANLLWKIIVRKNQFNATAHGFLGVILYCEPFEDDIFHWTRNISAEFCLHSNHTNDPYIRKFDGTKRFTQKARCHGITNFISWYDLMDPQNDYIQNNGISFTVNLRMASRTGAGINEAISGRCQKIKLNSMINGVNAADVNDNDDNNRNPNDMTTSIVAGEPSTMKLECSICLGNMVGREILSTTCGHLYCKQCILTSVKFQPRCPNCRTALDAKNLHPIHLPL